MYVAAETAIVINGTPEAVWEYASDPSNWTASNPEEHIGLEYFDSKDNRPATGVEFYQRASVAGVYADLRGRFLHVDRPRIAVWAGTAVYRMFGGLIHVRIPEGGVVRAEQTEGGTRLSHDVYMDFPNSSWGRFLLRMFRSVFKGSQAVYDHTYRELVFFKNQLEQGNRQNVGHEGG
jgi:hypothetical protein